MVPPLLECAYNCSDRTGEASWALLLRLQIVGATRGNSSGGQNYVEWLVTFDQGLGSDNIIMACAVCAVLQ